MRRIFTTLAAILVAMPVWAQDDAPALLAFGDDRFFAGRTVSHDADGTDDLFMAGDSVTGRTAIAGTAHLAGRDVSMPGAVGGDAYAAGETVSFGEVGGDATLAGRAVSVAGVGGDLRMAGSELRLSGEVGGYAMVAGEDVAFDAAVAGDVSLAAERVTWGEAAAIGGRLVVYEEEPGTLEVPERVVPAERVERREIEDWEGPEPPSLQRAIAGFLLGVVVVAALAALIAALVPERLAEMRRRILARPFHTLWLGFLAQSAVIGAGVLFAMTIIGIVLAPAMVLLALVAGFAGYVVAAYAFGVGLMLAFGRPEPDSIGERAAAAGAGALAAGIIGLIPFLGWLFVLALVLTGLGAITLRVLRPAFFTDTA